MALSKALLVASVGPRVAPSPSCAGRGPAGLPPAAAAVGLPGGPDVVDALVVDGVDGLLLLLLLLLRWWVVVMVVGGARGGGRGEEGGLAVGEGGGGAVGALEPGVLRGLRDGGRVGNGKRGWGGAGMR